MIEIATQSSHQPNAAHKPQETAHAPGTTSNNVSAIKELHFCVNWFRNQFAFFLLPLVVGLALGATGSATETPVLVDELFAALPVFLLAFFPGEMTVEVWSSAAAAGLSNAPVSSVLSALP